MKLGSTTSVKMFDSTVSDHGQRLSEKVCEIVRSGAPQDTELTLANTVTDPMQAHVHVLGAAGLLLIIGDADGGGVDAHDRSSRLGIANLGENMA